MNNDNIYIPELYNEYTSGRVMVMEWIDGIKITNTDELVTKLDFYSEAMILKMCCRRPLRHSANRYSLLDSSMPTLTPEIF